MTTIVFLAVLAPTYVILALWVFELLGLKTKDATKLYRKVAVRVGELCRMKTVVETFKEVVVHSAFFGSALAKYLGPKDTPIYNAGIVIWFFMCLAVALRISTYLHSLEVAETESEDK